MTNWILRLQKPSTPKRLLAVVAGCCLLLVLAPTVRSNADTTFELIRLDEPLTWIQARDSALNMGARLAVITDHSEQLAMNALLSQTDSAWIGGTDVVIEGTWVWVNGEPWSYSNWLSGHPVPLDGTDYLQIRGDMDGRWVSADDYADAFVIEWLCCLGPYAGNVDHDPSGGVDIADLIYLVDYMFSGGPAPSCLSETDLTGDGSIDIGDLVFLVEFMFTSGPTPPDCPQAEPGIIDTVIIVDQTLKPWDISYGVHYYGMDPDSFNFGLGPYHFPPVINPEFLSPGDDGYPSPGSTFPVLGLVLNGETRAYSLLAIISNEVVDDQIDSVHIAATY